MRYLIIGNGWLGNILKNYLGDRASIWKGRMQEINEQVKNFDVVVNMAAMTNIDWCEKNRFETFEVNTFEANRLAFICKRYGVKFVHISSACIFESVDSNDIKYEDSIPNPKCFYALTKWMAEELIKESNPDALIIRPRLPLSEVPHPRNTVNKLLSYDKINDNQESVTIVEDMIPVLIDLIEEDGIVNTGIFHLVNEGTISPAEIAESFGHKFERVTKEAQDARLTSEGRAKRVTTYVGSKRIKLLPSIQDRIKTLVEKYNG
jgi:dTDP-4-dehydrorhamnose reductase